MTIKRLVERSSALGDPRCAGKIGRRLVDVLMVLKAATPEDIAWCRTIPACRTRLRVGSESENS